MTVWAQMTPRQRRHKNRKQTLRRMVAAGRITEADRERLQAESRARLDDTTDDGGGGRLTAERRAALDAWRAAGPPAKACESDECLTAVGRQQCLCGCEGAWHGAAMGLPPLRPGPTPWTCLQCGQRGSGPPQQRYCSQRCGQIYRRRLAWRRRNRRRLCPECGLSFRLPYRQPTRRYCGADCAADARRVRDAASRRRRREAAA